MFFWVLVLLSLEVITGNSVCFDINLARVLFASIILTLYNNVPKSSAEGSIQVIYINQTTLSITDTLEITNTVYLIH